METQLMEQAGTMAASAYFAPPTKSAVSDGVSTRGLLSTAAALVLSIAPWTLAVRSCTALLADRPGHDAD